MITADPLADEPRVKHGFFTRQGGASRGIYESLNCGLGSGDRREDVLRNRATAARALGEPAQALVTVHQVHGTAVAEATGPWPDAPPVADAAIACTPGVALGILTADCAPVLLADGTAGIVGAVHCGWKGTLAGVAERAIEAMVRKGAATDRIRAIVGPCIAQASYEVGRDLRDRFVADDAETDAFFAPGRPGRLQFDLAGCVLHRLRRAGVGHASATGHDTYAQDDLFFSYRRATHRREADYGRQLSAIVLKPS